MINKPYLIAEIGINHNGSLDIAKKLINAAIESGFNAVKFQKRDIKLVYSKEVLDSPRESQWGTTQREQKLGLEFEKKEYDAIAEYCKLNKIEWLLYECKPIQSKSLHSFVTNCFIRHPFLLFNISSGPLSLSIGQEQLPISFGQELLLPTS